MLQVSPYGINNLDYVEAPATIEIGPVFLWFFIILGLAVLALAARLVIKRLSLKQQSLNQAIFLARLPKEKGEGYEKDFSIENLHEEIAKGEALIAALGGLRAERGFKAWLFGRADQFSMEVVAHQKLIYFYFSAPRERAAYLEQQILANYPDAVAEEVKDYNIFHPKNEVAAGFLKLKRSFVFPLRTYKKMDTDPFNAIINSISKLDADDGIAIQYMVRSAKAAWHRRLRTVTDEIKKGKSIEEALKMNKFVKALNKLGDLIQLNKDNSQEISAKEKDGRLSQMEEEIVKNIEEKNSKSGLEVNIRVVVSAGNKGAAAAHLQNIAGSFSNFNSYEYGNSFRDKINTKNQNKTINDFIHRRFSEETSFILNSEELAGLFHLPSAWTETPNIYWLTAKHAPAPADSPNEGIVLGVNSYRGVEKEIHIKRDDRRRHTYIIGKSGVGKSTLLASMAIQDILNGEGVGIIDPHGDFVEDVLARIPPERSEDVILFAPQDTERPLALNLLEFDPRYPEQKTFVINEMIKIFDKLYDLKSTGGPIFEQYMRNAMLLVMNNPESGSTLMEIPKVLADADFRKMKLDRCTDPTVVDFWRKEAEKAGGDAALANVVPYVTSKLTSFISNDMMRPIIGQQKSSFNLRDIMDKKKILLVSLPKGQVGEMNAYLLGMILVGKILAASLSRTDMKKEDRKDFYLYIDEFQNFTTDSISSILSEARKYNLNLIMAHQYIGQLVKNNDTSIKDAVFGNVGTWVSFKVGSEDAEAIVKEFEPVFNEYDLINIEKYTAYIKLLVDNSALRPFSMKTIMPLPGVERNDVAEKMRQLSRLKYGQDRMIIEAEIMRRTRGT